MHMNACSHSRRVTVVVVPTNDSMILDNVFSLLYEFLFSKRSQRDVCN